MCREQNEKQRTEDIDPIKNIRQNNKRVKLFIRIWIIEKHLKRCVRNDRVIIRSFKELCGIIVWYAFVARDKNEKLKILVKKALGFS